MNPYTLTLRRTYAGADYTIGRLYDGQTYLCDTLEPTVRQLPPSCPQTGSGKCCQCPAKIPGRTAILPGTYPLLRTYSPKFRCPMWRLFDVPHFEGILIHAGNSAADTQGCILVGYNTVRGRLTESKATLRSLDGLLQKLLRAHAGGLALRVQATRAIHRNFVPA